MNTDTRKTLESVLNGLERLELGARAERVAPAEENVMTFSIAAVLPGLGEVVVSAFQAELGDAAGKIRTRPRHPVGVSVEVGGLTLDLDGELFDLDRALFDVAVDVSYAALAAWRRSVAHAAERAVFDN
jgi:hypothetical protein